MKLFFEEKMKWLDEVNRFFNLLLTEEAKQISDKFRKGEF